MQALELNDLDPMPFGKYAGTPMQDVPTEYLHWFWHSGRKENGKAIQVMHYIRKSINALKLENRDLIWT